MVLPRAWAGCMVNQNVRCISVSQMAITICRLILRQSKAQAKWLAIGEASCNKQPIIINSCMAAFHYITIAMKNSHGRLVTVDI